MHSANGLRPNRPMPIADGPVGRGELHALFDPLADRPVLSLAVSGGADSLALMLLMQRWRAERDAGPDLWVFTVDHGLRPGAAGEAEMVAVAAGRLGLRARILRWEGAKPMTGVEEAAREARYGLLVEACREVGAADLLTAHHRDDQVETVLMRLGRGSGLAGLAAMRSDRFLAAGVTLRRPLLTLPKSRLAETVAAAGLLPAQDESNGDERFARAKLRRAMPALEAAGIGSPGVIRSASRLARADAALEHYVDDFLAQSASVDRFAVATLDRAAFRSVPAEIRLRALGRILVGIGGSDWPPPRSERLEALEAALTGTGPFKRTLGGAVVVASNEAAAIHREQGRMRLQDIALSAGDAGIWDGRFAFRIATAPAGLSIGPLGEAGRRSLELTGTPIAALGALPALRLNGAIVAVPPAGIVVAGAPPMAAEIHSVVGERIFG